MCFYALSIVVYNYTMIGIVIIGMKIHDLQANGHTPLGCFFTFDFHLEESVALGRIHLQGSMVKCYYYHDDIIIVPW